MGLRNSFEMVIQPHNPLDHPGSAKRKDYTTKSMFSLPVIRHTFPVYKV